MRRITILAIILLGCLFAWAGLSRSPTHTSLAREVVLDQPEDHSLALLGGDPEELARVGAPAGPQAPHQPLPDMALSEFSIAPIRPRVNEPITITIQAVNTGTADAPGVRVFLYIDPPIQPPTTTISETNSFVYGVTMPPGTSVLAQFIGYTFSAPGCQHVVYAWADPYNRTVESDETNNLRVIYLCVDSGFAVSPGADAYEPDDTCSASVASIPSDGTPQVRSFAPITDVDYVRLQVTEGITYTITAAGTGRDAEPNLELSDSCNYVPPFGTTTRLQFVAPTSGTYYLKLSNTKPNPDPNQTTYQLTVRAEGQAPSGDPPVVQGIIPTTGQNDRNTNVTITGVQFLFPTMAEICLYRDGACAPNCTQLLNATWASSQKLYAVVPPNLNDLGAYCVQATNPGGRKGLLPNAFTMLSSQPDPREVVPPQGYSNEPTDLHIYGFNFAEGISLTMGTVGLENIKVINGTHIVATLPQGLAPGTYSLIASYQNGSGQLGAAFTVLPSSQDSQNLYAQSNEFWIDPLTPHVGKPVSLGLVVHRVSGTAPLVDLPVRFAVNGMTIGDAILPTLAVNGQDTTGRVYYTPTAQGAYTFTALIDPGQTVSESTRADNTVARTVSVIEAAGDTLAPLVDGLTIKGARQTVTTTQVILSAEATDALNPPGVGAAEVRYIELEYSLGARLWVPTRDSKWLNYTLNHFNHVWTLTPVGGIHYIQAWAKDGAGNVSRYPYQQMINYLPPTDWVSRGQMRVYRQTLALSESLHVTLTPLSGDADLCIWPPDWKTGGQTWVSSQDGSTVEDVTFTAPVSGVYQIEVYGNTTSQHELKITVGAMGAVALQSPAGVAGRRWPYSSPLMDIDDEPPRDIPSAPPEHKIYLPLVLCSTSLQ